MSHPARRAVLHRPYRPQTRNLIAAMTTKPTTARAREIDALVGALIDGGVWARLDILRVYAAADSQAALLDWIDPTRSGTVVNSPTFTADRGYSCDATTQYLNTNFTPSTQAVQMTASDAMLASYERANSASAGRVMGSSGGGPLLEVVSRQASDQITGRLNSGDLTPLKGGVTDSRGFTGWQRAGGTNGQAVKNGVVDAPVALTGATGLALPTGPIFVNCRNVNGTPQNFRGSDYGLIAAGRSLTDPQWLTFYNAAQAYMTALGANV